MLRDDQGLSSAVHIIQKSEAFGLEFASGDGFVNHIMTI
jgi:hypothetical protein